MKRFMMLVSVVAGLVLVTASTSDACWGLFRCRRVGVCCAPPAAYCPAQPDDTDGFKDRSGDAPPVPDRSDDVPPPPPESDDEVAPPAPGEDAAPPAPAEPSAPPAPAPQAAVNGINGLRIWTDATGQHRARAVFASAQGDVAYFESEDGRLVKTAMSKLSREDQELIRSSTSQQVRLATAQ
jgi:hypothetical protein